MKFCLWRVVIGRVHNELDNSIISTEKKRDREEGAEGGESIAFHAATLFGVLPLSIDAFVS
jgi:hypothetical protein